MPVPKLDLDGIDEILKHYAVKADQLNDQGMGDDREFIVDELLDERLKLAEESA